MPFCVFDIESIPDPSVQLDEDVEAEAATKDDEAEKPRKKSKKRASAEPKSSFRPPFAQQPIVIGYLWFDDQYRPGVFGMASAEQMGGEKALLLGFSQMVSTPRPKLVSWNGRGFDMPLIEMRSFRHAVSQGWHHEKYRYRYGEDWHLDMMEIMSNYGAAGKKGFSLDKFAKLIGLPGKVGIDGSMVAEVYAAGGLADIETYCATDVVQTACVFLRHAVMRGRLGVTQHNEAIDMIVERLAADSRYEKFLAGIDINRLRIDEASAAVG